MTWISFFVCFLKATMFSWLLFSVGVKHLFCFQIVYFVEFICLIYEGFSPSVSLIKYIAVHSLWTLGSLEEGPVRFPYHENLSPPEGDASFFHRTLDAAVFIALVVISSLLRSVCLSACLPFSSHSPAAVSKSIFASQELKKPKWKSTAADETPLCVAPSEL